MLAKAAVGAAQVIAVVDFLEFLFACTFRND